MRLLNAGAVVLLLLIVEMGARPQGRAAQEPTPPEVVTLSVVGTNDLHGNIHPSQGRGGLAVFGGYLQNLKAARAADQGAVLAIDSGDTYQGGLDSNLSEGAVVIDAYNAMGYTALAIGNHDFDYGAIDVPGPLRSRDEDQRGTIKARASQATFPFLAANLLDSASGRPVTWDNVRPSAIVKKAGITIGVIGVMTIDAMRSTLAAHVHGLEVGPITPAIVREATALRQQGAQVVIVGAHAGGRCTRFEHADDLSSCEPSSEIFEVAQDLPPGLVDLIVAGHTHAGLAHTVNGVAIIEAFSQGQSFSRADVIVDRRTHNVLRVQPFAPQDLCLALEADTGRCAATPVATGASGAAHVPARYEGRDVHPDQAVLDAMAPALARVRERRGTPVGVTLETAITRAGAFESPLGNLFADALRSAVPGADVAVNNNGRGGLRLDLAPGLLTFGAIYDVFPFDNRLVQLTVRGSDLVRVFTTEVREGRQGALGVSGIRVRIRCDADTVALDLTRESGEPIDPGDQILVATTDQLASRGLFGRFWMVPLESQVYADAAAPLVRDAVLDWLRARGGTLNDSQFIDHDHPRWQQDGGCLSASR